MVLLVQLEGPKDCGQGSEGVMHDSTRDLTGSHTQIGIPASNLRSALTFVLSTSAIFGSFHPRMNPASPRH
jgi:hypothetical protein